MNVSGVTAQSNPYRPTPAGSQAAPREAADARRQTPASQSEELSAEDLAQIRDLQARDKAVRRHEQAHLAAAGGLVTSGPQYTYQKGPDGVNYAVGGEVRIDTSPGQTPEETLSRAQTIRAAALAPSDPSAQDRAVAARAAQMAREAQAEIARLQVQSAASDTGGRGLGRDVGSYYGQATNPGASGGALNVYA